MPHRVIFKEVEKMINQFPDGWALQKPQQTMEPALFEAMWRQGELIPTRKRDGNRGHIITSGERTRIYSHNGTLDLTDKLEHIAWHFAKAPAGWLIDVELHTLEEGTHSFQKAMNNDPSEILVSPFDMLRLDGCDLNARYRDRYQRVDEFHQAYSGFPMSDKGVYFALGENDGYDDVLKRIEWARCEGIVVWDAKGTHALNLNGNTKRGRSWKIKIRQTEDLVVYGWNKNKGDPSLGVGSLNLQRPDPMTGKLTKAGKVGSFDKQFDRIEAMTMAAPYIVEVSHYGIDENGNMAFPKIERRRDDLASEFGQILAA